MTDTVAGARLNGKEAAEAAGVTYRQFDHWCRRGYLGPEARAASEGSGNGRLIPASAIERAVIVDELSRLLGVIPHSAARVAEAVVVRGRAGVTAGNWTLTRTG